MERIKSSIVIGLACLLVFSSVRMSAPLLGFLFFHDNYLYECTILQHHSEHCAGYCVLKKELASQSRNGSEIPEPVLQKQLKALDLFTVAAVEIPKASAAPFNYGACYASSLVDNPDEILSPPPRFLSI